jgi:methionyl-tRNA formyltransferase
MESPLTIGYFADGPWGRRALTRIRDAPALRVRFIVGRHPEPDPALRWAAEELHVPFYSVQDVNRPAFREKIRTHEADIHVSMSFDQILEPEIIEMAPEGFINCHAGALPFYRGRNVLNWVLINGDDRFGVTVHEMEEQIDTGDILLQRFAEIDASDDYASLLDKAATLCADTLHDALLQLQDGTAERTPQEEVHPVGFYSSKRREGDEWIDWRWSSRRIHNFVRALVPPGPAARTRTGTTTLAILDTERIPDAPDYIDRPGTVVGTDEHGVVVKTGDNTIRVHRVADVAGGECKRQRVPAYPIGTELGRRPRAEMRRLQRRVAELEQRLEQIDTGDR